MTRFHHVLVDARYDDTCVTVPSHAYATYDEAQQAVTRAVERLTHAPTYGYRLLLDLGSVDVTDADELTRLVLTVPLLHAVFEYGRQLGTEDAARVVPYRGPRYPHPLCRLANEIHSPHPITTLTDRTEVCLGVPDPEVDRG